jgi:hypothetical protein
MEFSTLFWCVFTIKSPTTRCAVNIFGLYLLHRTGFPEINQFIYKKRKIMACASVYSRKSGEMCASADGLPLIAITW